MESLTIIELFVDPRVRAYVVSYLCGEDTDMLLRQLSKKIRYVSILEGDII